MNQELEIFKDIPGYENLYMVSNIGRVKSCAKIKIHKTGNLMMPEKILTPMTNSGYKRVRLYKNNKREDIMVHRLVMLSFIGQSNLTVDHIDGNRSNNNLSNLRYCSQRMNNIYAREKMDSSSRYVGVGYHKHSGLWRSYMTINGKFMQFGLYKTEEEASAIYQNRLKIIENAI